MHQIILFKRITELKKDIDMYQRMLEKYPDSRIYKDKLRDLQHLKDFNEAIYFKTGAVQ